MSLAIILFFAFCTKHLIVDFVLQRPYQYRNKGTYGHFGGILHALIHTITTLVLLLWLTNIDDNEYLLILSVFEGVIHYHVDWAKVNINNKMGWRADNTDWFWFMVGLDQYIHLLTYIAIIYAVS